MSLMLQFAPVYSALLLLFVGFHFANLGPVPGPEATSAAPPPNLHPTLDEGVDEYDQRQNGSENVRIHMNDVTLVVAPSDGLLQLMSASAGDLFNGSNEVPTSNNKPPAQSSYSSAHTDCASESGAKCKQQSHKKHRIRLSSLLLPLLSRAAGGN